jgi:hypothetical protein
VNKSSILLAFACGTVIFSIDEKTKQKNLGKIKAKLPGGTLAHVFYHSNPAPLIRVLNFVIFIQNNFKKLFVPRNFS